VRAVQIYAATNIPQVASGGAAAFLAITPETLRQFLGQQEIFLFFITVYAGAGLIANDRRANALQLYLSKPLTRAEYILGKLAVLMAFLLLVTWVPGMTLLLVQIMFSGSFSFVTTNLHLVPAITLFSFIQAITLATAMLALSSLSNSSRYVGILYAGLLFFTQALYGVLLAFTGDSRHAWISLRYDLSQVGDVIFRLMPGQRVSPAVSALVIVLVIAASVAVLEWRVRAVEIVA